MVTTLSYQDDLKNTRYYTRPKWSIPFSAPVNLLSNTTAKIFNSIYYRKPIKKSEAHLVHLFIYSLDSINQWNFLYGKRGFYQYQCVVPFADDQRALGEILALIRNAGQGSFLAVLKTFGAMASLGMLSFPRPGVTLALDFPNNGKKTLALFSSLDEIVAAAGGCLYPGKDARMSALMFSKIYPSWEEFAPFVDPKFSSSFWRRVMEKN